MLSDRKPGSIPELVENWIYRNENYYTGQFEEIDEREIVRQS